MVQTAKFNGKSYNLELEEWPFPFNSQRTSPPSVKYCHYERVVKHRSLKVAQSWF